MNGQLDILKILLKFGADPNSYFRDYETPLHLAAKKGDLDMVKVLIKYNADHKQHTMGHRKQAYHFAEEHGHNEVFQFLLGLDCEKYAPVRNGFGKNP